MFGKGKKWKLRSKLFLMVLLQVALVLFIGSYLNMVVEKDMRQKLTAHNHVINDQTVTAAKDMLADVKGIFDTTLTYENAPAMRNLEQLVYRLNQFKDINVLARPMLLTWAKYFRELPYVTEISITSDKGQSLAKNPKNEYTLSATTGRDAQWIAQSIDSRGDYVLGLDDGRLYLARQVIYPQKYERLGVMRVDVDPAFFEDHYQASMLFAGQRSGLFIRGQRVAGDLETPYPLLAERLGQSGSDEIMQVDVPGKKVYLFSRGAGAEDILSVTEIPYGEVFGDVILSNSAMLFFMAIYMILSFFIITQIVKGVTSSLKVFENAFLDIESGRFGVEIAQPVEPELEGFLQSYNQMTVHLEELIYEVYQKDIAQRTLEIQMLRSQINPHFFYNTLEALRMNCEKGQEQYNKRIIEHLSRVLRYGLSADKKPVLVSDEIRHLQCYVELNNLRCDTQVELGVFIQPELMHKEVIKLLFQPLIENAIQHGILPGRQALVIQIMGYQRQGDVVFTIADDGAGIKPDRLAALNQSLQGQEIEERVGIGVKNVHRRLQLHYGEQYGLAIRSVYGQGTEIAITLPGEGEHAGH